MPDEQVKDQPKTETPPFPGPFEIAILPLQNTTLFPETVVPLAVGRDRSVRAVESALSTEEKLIGCITTKTENITGDEAKFEDLYKIGTIVKIKRMMGNDGIMQLIVQGTDRFEIVDWIEDQPYIKAKIQVLPDLKGIDEGEIEALKRNIQTLIQQALALLPNVPPEIRMAVMTQT